MRFLPLDSPVASDILKIIASGRAKLLAQLRRKTAGMPSGPAPLRTSSLRNREQTSDSEILKEEPTPQSHAVSWSTSFPSTKTELKYEENKEAIELSLSASLSP
ncbi:hypothetical protein QE152_g9718 [Popillia japonica]|uniref:Uncharacterized protein n=1 Tax=Popillia japonica TaxID=7064 RepID=A0AAW1LTZ7_POPJA